MSEAVRSLFVTLRRGTAGKPWPHRRIVEALGLSRPHDCVEKPNTASIRGMLMKIPHLVVVETDKMFYFRNMRTYYEGLCRPPLVVQHSVPTPLLPAPAPPHMATKHTQAQLQEHVQASGMEGFRKNWTPKKPIKHVQDRYNWERVKALTESGLYSQRVWSMNKRHVERHAQALNRRESGGTD